MLWGTLPATYQSFTVRLTILTEIERCHGKTQNPHGKLTY